MSALSFRIATASDLPAIIGLIADDQLGQAREDASLPLDQRYLDAFAAIVRDPNQRLVVTEQDGALIGCMQITFIPGIAARRLARPDRIGPRCSQQARCGHRRGHVRMGDRGVPPAGLLAGPAL